MSPLTHLRSEKEPSTLMRMVMGNNVSIAETLDLASQKGTQKYFSVETDKARILFGRLTWMHGRLPRPPHQWCGGLGPGSAGLRSRSGLLAGAGYTGRLLRGRPSAPLRSLTHAAGAKHRPARMHARAATKSRPARSHVGIVEFE